MDHPDDDVCPVTPPTGTDITYTGLVFTDPSCSSAENDTSMNNCSTKIMTAEITTQHSDLTSTRRVFLDSGTTEDNQTTDSSGIVSTTDETVNQNTTILNTSNSSATVKSSSPASLSSSETPLKPNKTSQTATTLRNISSRIHDIISTQSSSADVISGTQTQDPTLGTPPTDKYVYKSEDDGMTYWPAIVGGVLGGLALIAAAGFLLYYKRQK